MLSSKDLSCGPKSLSSPLAISNDETVVNVSVDTYTPNVNDQLRNIHSLTGDPIEGPMNQRLTYASGSRESKGRNGVSSAGSADGDKRLDSYPYTGTGRPSLTAEEEASAQSKTSSSSRRDTYCNLSGETPSSPPGPPRLGAFGSVSVQDVPRHGSNPGAYSRSKSLLDESSLKMSLPGSDLGAFSTTDRPSAAKAPSTSPSTFAPLQAADYGPGHSSLLSTRRPSLDRHGHVPQQFWSPKQQDADSDIIQREVSAKRKSGVGAVSAFFGRQIESSGVTTEDSPSAARLRLAPIHSPKVCPETSSAVSHLASPPRSGPDTPR